MSSATNALGVKKLSILATFLFTIVFTLFLNSTVVNATMSTLKNVGGQSGFNPDTDATTMSSTIGVVLGAFLSILGVLFVSLIVYAGYLWMTDAGNSQQVEKSKQLISRAIIGLIITTSAWVAWSFIFEKIILGK